MLSFSLMASTPEPITELNDFSQYRSIQAFKLRASTPYLSITEHDLALINEYIELNKAFNGDFSTLKGTGYLLVAISKALEHNKIPDSMLDSIHQLAVAASQYDRDQLMETIGHVFIRDLDEMLWLIELRKIHDQDQLIDYLQNSLKKGSENKHVLGILVQQNLHHLVAEWYSGKNIKEFDLLLLMLQERAELAEELSHNRSPEVLLADAYTELISHVFLQYEAASPTARMLWVQQTDWLLTLFNAHKNKTKVHRIIQQLNEDWLVFNTEALKMIASENPAQSFKRIFSDLKVMWKTAQILDEELTYHGSPTFSHQIKSKQHIDNKLLLINAADLKSD